jgi:hypothetical protein
VSGLIYIEFASRRQGVSLRQFHNVVGGAVSGWGAGGADVPLLNMARTWRIGPEPEYVCIWYSPGQGLEQIDEWERLFLSGAVDELNEPYRLAARLDRGGCYEPLLEPLRSSRGRYYGEWLDFEPGTGREDVRAFFETRRARHPDLELSLLIDRIGKLGPDPRGLAVWGLPSWGSLDGICRELDDPDAPIRLVTASCYADLGKEHI